MPGAAKPEDEAYIEVGYEDKVVFMPKKMAKRRPNVMDTWQSSQGLWADHPVFGSMDIKEVIEWLRGEDCDI
jgi:hypothetical protein